MVVLMSRIAFVAWVIVVATSGSVGAQATAERAAPQSDTRWYPWLGCWRAVSVTPADTSGPLVCVVPAGTSAVEAMTIANGAVVARERIEADGRTHPFEQDGCRGTQSGRWAATGKQVYVLADFTCGDSLAGSSKTLMAFSSSGDWIESVELRAAGGTLERATRYHDAGLPASVSKDVAASLRRRQLATATARAAAAGPITSTDVDDAVRNVGAAVVRPWLVERGERFDLATATTGAEQPVVSQPMPPQYQTGTAVESGAAGYTCTSMVCYGRSPYSAYNGAPMYPYAPYPYAAFGYAPYGYGYPLGVSPYFVRPPVIVVGGVSRQPLRLHPPSAPIGHQPIGHGSGRRRP